MKKEEIKTYIPHREPMLLVEEINIDEHNVAHAYYKVTGEEFFLKGHFPDNPIVPGVILCEIMAQSCCLLIGDLLKGKTPFYAGIDNVRFKKQVRPGDIVEVTSKIANNKGLIFIVESIAKVKGDLCAKGTLTFALIENEKLNLK
jgi:3-hydroxyacyl-[acyl-carrier-protein] dehydratase